MTIYWWTIGLQAINVTVLIWILARFFWRPVAAIIEQRRSASAAALDDAEATRKAAAAALADLERSRAGIAKERAGVIDAARGEAEQARATLIEAAERQAAAMAEASRAALRTERDDAVAEWEVQARRLAVDISRRLVGRLGSAAVDERFLAGLLDEIEALPGPERQSVAAEGGVVEAVSAAPIGPADQDRYRKLIADAFGAAPTIVFKVEEELLAGLELRGPHLAIHNSWRADLDRISDALGHERQS